VLLLYGEALAALRRARRLGDPRADLGRALSILAELAASLAEREDREAVLNLASLYHYMIHRLMEAVECGSPVPIIEVERLLQTLWEGWVQVMQSDVGGGFSRLAGGTRQPPFVPSVASVRIVTRFTLSAASRVSLHAHSLTFHCRSLY
jgi:flagellin-specific chaperone FliS